MKVSDPCPSTSREARQESSKTPPAMAIRPAKSFVKFKDNKSRTRTKKYITQSNGKQMHFGCSPSQQISRKILRTIKRKINLNNSKNQIVTNYRSRSRYSVCDLTVKDVAKESKVTRGNDDDDDDDDCVLIDTSPPEIILIDDESVPNCDASDAENSSKDLNISNISRLSNNRNLVLKTYHPIGSTTNYQQNQTVFYETLHSTPKQNSNDSTIYPVAPRYIKTMSMILEETPYSPSDRVVDDISDERIPPRRKRRTDSEDDSVIFVSEGTQKPPRITADGFPLGTRPGKFPISSARRDIRKRQRHELCNLKEQKELQQNNDNASNPTADFIPLATATEKYPVSATKREPRKKRACTLFNSKEQKELQQYNDNAYNPDKDTPTTSTPKRMVIVDGSNVAYNHALNKEFSVKGLKICLEYFEKLGHEVKAVVPQFRLQRLKSTDPAALEKLHEEGKIVFTPCKNLPGKSSSSYDDRFILQLAAELDAAIVSNDNYRDLMNENPAFKKIVENRVVGFSWCNDLFILPKDPYGKWGPSLATILNRS